MEKDNFIESKECSSCKQEKPRILFAKKQWDRKKFRRCKQCNKETSRRNIKKKETFQTQIDPKKTDKMNLDKSQIGGIDLDEDVLLRAKRLFLSRNHQQAWETCNSYFERRHCNMTDKKESLSLAAENPQEENKDYVSIYITFQGVNLDQDDMKVPIRVELDTTTKTSTSNNSVFDQFVVIALQNWQEIQDSSPIVTSNRPPTYDISLKPLIQAMSSQHRISLEVFCVWMEFTRAQGYEFQALEWNLQVLLPLLSQKSHPQRQDLLIQCLGDQLPLIQDYQVATQIAECLLYVAERSQPLSPFLVPSKLLQSQKLGSKPQSTSIEAIQSVWKGKDHVLSEKAWKQICSAWEPYHSQHSTTTTTTTTTSIDNGHEDTSCTEMNDDNTKVTFYPPRSPKFFFQMVDSTLHWFRSRLRSVIQEMIENPQAVDKSQVAVSLALTLVAWRQRKVLKLMLGYLFVPIKELLDALKLSSHSIE